VYIQIREGFHFRLFINIRLLNGWIEVISEKELVRLMAWIRGKTENTRCTNPAEAERAVKRYCNIACAKFNLSLFLFCLAPNVDV
jgi:hypothetical protein